MNKKLKLQDFTFLINIIKDQDNWNIQDLADKLTVDLDTLLYMLNIMSEVYSVCLLYTSPSPRDRTRSRMPSSA